jgi:hypothetical protein
MEQELIIIKTLEYLERKNKSRRLAEDFRARWLFDVTLIT